MADLKPRLFIASSKEGLKIARHVATCMADYADTTVWDDKVFGFMKSYFETLLTVSGMYDYGIMVATADDFTTSRHKAFDAPRDNVIFECGLFLGRLGPRKVFFLREEGTKLPSDLLGISLPSFPKKGPKRLKAVETACDHIKGQLRAREKVSDYGFLPSVAIAMGYFDNFVRRTCDRLLEERKITVEGKEVAFREFRFHVLIPQDLSDDMFDKVKAARMKREWKQIKVDAGGQRPFDFHLDLSRQADGVIELYDIPITLNSLHGAIQAFLSKSAVGKDQMEEMLEHREIRAFKKVLDTRIGESSLSRGRVATEIVDV